MNAAGATTATRVEDHGGTHRYTISSLSHDREECLEVAVTPAAGGADVTVMVTDGPAPTVGLARAVAANDAGSSDDETTQRDHMRRQLCRLRSAISGRLRAVTAGRVLWAA